MTIHGGIPFTQYMRPTGRPMPTSIKRPDDIMAKAEAILAKGLVFECEMLSDGMVSLTITDPDEGDIEETGGSCPWEESEPDPDMLMEQRRDDAEFFARHPDQEDF